MSWADFLLSVTIKVNLVAFWDSSVKSISQASATGTKNMITLRGSTQVLCFYDGIFSVSFPRSWNDIDWSFA